VLIAWLWPTLAAAQPGYPPSLAPKQQIHVAATERALWLAVVQGTQSRLFFREAGSEFKLRGTTNLPIATMTALDRDLLVFFDDGAAYRYDPDPDPPAAESILPARQAPLEMVGERGRVYAVVPSSAAAGLLVATRSDSVPTTQPFDPGSAPLSLALYDGRSWKAVAALPPLVSSSADRRLRPRLCLAQGQLLLLAPAERPDHILHFRYDEESGEWMSRGTIGTSQLAAFWVVNFSRVPTLVTMSDSGTGGERLSVYRLLGDVEQADATAWSRADDLKLSDVPEGVTIVRYGGACGFNQHLGLTAFDSSGVAYLRFARIGASPAEPTQLVADILAEPALLDRSHGLVQMFTFVVLLAVLTGLFVFRRGSMVKLVELPPGCALASNVQRMLGWLIDFAPFTLAAAAMLDVPWSEGFGTLAKWGISPSPESGMPQRNVLVWWGLSVFGYTMYMLVMELLTRRTVGKVIIGIRLLSEAGTSPTGWQILARNVTRLIELMPQFWIFVVLVLLSRNRQRMGDIFARTVAVRLTVGQPRGGDEDSSQSRDARSSAPHQDDATTTDRDEQDSSGGDSSEDQT
jgi:uncharacterized RDD family membrane protein YckC